VAVRFVGGGGPRHVRDAKGALEREQAGLEDHAEEGAGQVGEPLGAGGAPGSTRTRCSW
jgi:hypothetical protein